MKNIAIVFSMLISFALKAQVIPTYETFSLKNGLKVYLLQYGNIPAINVKLVLNSGKVHETPGQQNYSDMVSNAILMGNAKYDAESQLNKAFAYRLGKIFLIDAPLETILATIESEFYGSMGRTREFALKGSSYSFKPANLFSFWKPAGGMTYDREAIENDASRMQLAQISCPQ